MSDLLESARAWIADVHPHARHLERTLDWLVDLDPEAATATRIAAVTHDIERAFPDPGSQRVPGLDFDSPRYIRWYQDRCADIVAGWLRDHGADEAMLREVEALVRAHEDGGWPEVDLIQAADSLSFLEVMVPVVERWTTDGPAPPERAAEKLRLMRRRISPSLERPQALADPMLAAGLERIDGVAVEVAEP